MTDSNQTRTHDGEAQDPSRDPAPTADNHDERGDATAAPVPGSGADVSRAARREVEVPMRLYKTVTVFSTLIAAVSVVAGFVLLDAATLQVSLLRGLILLGLRAVGAVPPTDALTAGLAVAGLGLIGLGAGVYVLGTRFRAAGMSNAQEDDGGTTDDG